MRKCAATTLDLDYYFWSCHAVFMIYNKNVSPFAGPITVLLQFDSLAKKYL